MKNVPSLSTLATLGASALIAAASVSASAQTVAGRAAIPGMSAAIVPTIGTGLGAPSVSGSLGSPLALSLTPALSAPAALAAAPLQLAPAALAPVDGTVSAASRMKDATAALAVMPNLARVSGSQARGAGTALEAALTGEKYALSAAAVADAPRGFVNYDSGATPEMVALAQEKAATVKTIRAEISKVIVGQVEMIDSIISALIASEHVLLEGVPGVAKTVTAKAVSDSVEGRVQRVQGTNDKLPSDILGTEIMQEDPETGKKSIVLEQGPVFTNILIVDEINRMTAKTQSALLEAMAEGRVTIGRQTLTLPKPFTVLATQNPVDSDGVNPLPVAQQDRFMFKVLVENPAASDNDELMTIMLRNSRKDGQAVAGKITNLDELIAIRKVSEDVFVDMSILKYIDQVVKATNNPAKFGIDAKDLIESGSSPRGAIFMIKAAKINALLDGRAWVGPQDVRAVAARILRHRITLTYAAGKMTTDDVVENILGKVPVPKPEARAAAPLARSDKKN